MTFAQQRNRLTTRFSERIPFVKRLMTAYGPNARRLYVNVDEPCVAGAAVIINHLFSFLQF